MKIVFRKKWGGNPAPVYDRPESEFWREHNFITIRNSGVDDENCAVPVSGPNILKLQFDSLKATIGQGLINVLTPVIKVINTIIGKLMSLANAFKSFDM